MQNNSFLSPEFFSAIAAVLSFFTSVVAVYISVNFNKISIKHMSAMTLLEVENQINTRKSELDKVIYEINKNIHKNRISKKQQNRISKKQLKIFENYLNACKENYYNSLDRLCFAILKEYLKEDDLMGEYKTLLKETITNDEESFSVQTPYKNIIKLNNKWQKN